MQQQQRQLIFGSGLIVVFLALSFVLPNFLSQVFSATVVGGMSFSFVLLLVVLAPSVMASAICASFLQGKTMLQKIGLFALSIVLSSLLFGVTFLLGSLSDRQAQEGVFWEIFSTWWIYLYGFIVSGFVVLLEYSGAKITMFRKRR